MQFRPLIPGDCVEGILDAMYLEGIQCLRTLKGHLLMEKSNSKFSSGSKSVLVLYLRHNIIHFVLHVN